MEEEVALKDKKNELLKNQIRDMEEEKKYQDSTKYDIEKVEMFSSDREEGHPCSKCDFIGKSFILT